LPFCPECGAEISVDVKFCPDCGAKNIRNSEGVVASPNIPSPKTNNRMKRTAGKPQKLGPVIAIVFVLGLIFVILLATGSLGNLLSNTSSSGPPSPTAVATQGTVYPSWLKVNNWYQDQIVRYVAVSLDTGRSYEANYAVAPWPGTSQNPVTGTLALPIPGNGAYKVTVYTAGGHSVWWNSVYLNVENQQNPANLDLAGLQSGYANSSGNLNTSTLDGIQCSGSS
jgi:zinc ribbon protein